MVMRAKSAQFFLAQARFFCLSILYRVVRLAVRTSYIAYVKNG